MAKMVNPELEVVRFENEDVIAHSPFYIDAKGNIVYASVPNDTVIHDGEKSGTVQDNKVDGVREGWYYYINGDYSRQQ